MSPEHILYLELGGLVLMLISAAFFAGTETALTGASRARMHALENDGDERAKRVNRLREKKEKLIGALLLGNTLVSVSVGALTSKLTISTIGEGYVLPATFTVAVIMLIFSEVMPKTYALIHADRVALFWAPVVSFVVTVFSPMTHAVEKVVNGFFHMTGVDRRGITSEAQEEELRGAIDLLGDHEESESEEGQETRAMLRSILDLAGVTVEKIMIHRKNVKMLNLDQPVAKIVDEVLHSSFTRLPVWKGEPDNIVGILHAKLLLQELRHCNGDVSKVKIENTMLDPWFVPESTTLFDQLQGFRKRREHFGIAVDEYGALMGVITMEDILEEIVGQIDDEHDVAVTGVRPQPDGSLLLDGKVTIRDLNREFDWGLPDEDYSTIAGLLLFETQRIPSVGQTFTFYGFRFEVMKKQRNQITVVRIIPAEEEKEAA
jgi:Mg2+/Co2+ transporter CorB